MVSLVIYYVWVWIGIGLIAIFSFSFKDGCCRNPSYVCFSLLTSIYLVDTYKLHYVILQLA